MFDAEEVSVCINAFYNSDVTDDIFTLLYGANKTNVTGVKTPNGVTERATISKGIMQRGVLSPLMFSNMLTKT